MSTSIVRRLDALEAANIPGKSVTIIVRFVVGPDGIKDEPTHAWFGYSKEDGEGIYRMDDESALEFEDRAKAEAERRTPDAPARVLFMGRTEDGGEA
jgi:hypothetical protein